MTSQGAQNGWWRILFYWGPVVGYAGLIFYLSGQSNPDEDLPSLFGELNDKVSHAMEYAGLGGLCYRAFRWGTNGPVADRALLFAILAASLYGVTDEIHQLFVPLRESSWQDWLADVSGGVFGAGVVHRLGAKWTVLFAADARLR